MNNVVCYSIVFIAGITPTNHSIIFFVKNSKLRRCIRASLATAIYGNKMLDCLLSMSHGLIGL